MNTPMWGRAHFKNDPPEPFPNLRRQVAEWKPTGQLHLTELFAHEATREGLHHLLCLPVLLQQLVDLLHGSAAALGDAPAPASVDDHMIVAFAPGHRIDDGYYAVDFVLVHLDALEVLENPYLGHHAQQRF